MTHISRISLLLSILLSLSLTALAQNPIPNSSFENWTEGEPDSWFTNNIFGVATFITQSNESHSGSYAVKGEVATYFETVAPPLLGSTLEYIPISQNYASLTGYYQFSTSGSDSFYVSVILLDAQYVTVAAGFKIMGTTSGGYSSFTVDLEYIPLSEETAAYALIEFTIINEFQVYDPSSTFLLDDIAFSGFTAIESPLATNVPDKFSLEQNYPNPFNPLTNIKYQLPQAELVTITVYNMLGQKVKTLLNNEMSAGIHQVQFDAANLAGGVYFYEIRAGNFVQMKKMTLVK